MKTLPKLDLNITNQCNYHCLHCAFDSGETEMPELSIKKIREILEDTKTLGGQRFDITGGEPLIRNDVQEIIRIGKEFNYKIELVTNGSLISLERLLEFKKSGLDSIALSLDGHDYQSYARIRQTSQKTYHKVLQSVDQILTLGIPLKINTLACQSNYQDLPQLTQWCVEKGVKEHGLYYFTAVGRGKKTQLQSVDPTTWLSFIRESLCSLEKDIKISLEFPYLEKGRLEGKNLGCLAETEQYHLQILPDRNVYPCAVMASYHLPLANLDQTSVKEIWHNQPLWSSYWQKATKIFEQFDGCCVDLKRPDQYQFVCPLRKFSPGDCRC